jgi:hypothetical protein
MKFPTMMLAVALVTIVGPAAATVYSECQLATLVTNNGITSNNADCKCITPLSISLKINLKEIYCNDVHFFHRAEDRNCWEGVF